MKPYIRNVNYYETDQMHVVHHSNYARYMEEARLFFMEQIGLSYDKLEEMGIIIPVLELHDYYTSALTYGDTFEVRAQIVRLTPVRFTVQYEFYKIGSGDKVHTGETSHAFVDTEFRPMNLRKKYPEVFEELSKHVVDSF